MTFTDLVTEVMARTRQTSDEARTRIGRAVNDRYRRVTSSVGLGSSRRGTSTMPTVIGASAVVFPVPKLVSVYFVTPQRSVLGEITFDEWRRLTTELPMTGLPRVYAVESLLAGTVEVQLYPTPDAVYSVHADTVDVLPTLAAADVPQFSADFHDILMHGALADEWFQLKQDDLSKRSEAMYEQRLSELRYFIIKSGYLDIYQGKRAEGAWPWSRFPRSGAWW